MQEYFHEVYVWITRADAWLGIGPVWQAIGIMLGFFTILQLLPNALASGTLFSKKGLKITFALDAIWVYLVFAAAFVPTTVTIVLLVVAGLGIAAFLSWKKWH